VSSGRRANGRAIDGVVTAQRSKKCPVWSRSSADGQFPSPVVANKEFQANQGDGPLCSGGLAKWEGDAEPCRSRTISFVSSPACRRRTKTIILQQGQWRRRPARRPWEAHVTRGPISRTARSAPSCAVAQINRRHDDSVEPTPRGVYYPDRQGGALPRCCGCRQASVPLVSMSRVPAVTVITAPDDGGSGNAALIARRNCPACPCACNGMREAGSMPGRPIRGRRVVDEAKGVRSTGSRRHPSDWQFRSPGATPIRCGRAAPDRCWRAQHPCRTRSRCRRQRPIPLGPRAAAIANAIPIYKFPNAQVVHHFHPGHAGAGFRRCARSVAYHNVFLDREFYQRTRRSGRRPTPFEFRLKTCGGTRRGPANVIEKAGAGRLAGAKGQKAPSKSGVRLLRSRALQESSGLLRHRQRSRSQPRDRASAAGGARLPGRSTAARWSTRTGLINQIRGAPSCSR